MKTYSYSSKEGDALGIYVEFADSEDDVFRYKLQDIQPYRFKLRISLPPGLREKWVSGVIQVIRRVEAGQKWPLRLSSENAFGYFTMEQLRLIERSLPGIEAYVYGVEEKSAFNEDELRKWSNAALRDRYAKLPTLASEF